MSKVEITVEYGANIQGMNCWTITASKFGYGCGQSGMSAKTTDRQMRDFKRRAFAYLGAVKNQGGDL